MKGINKACFYRQMKKDYGTLAGLGKIAILIIGISAIFAVSIYLIAVNIDAINGFITPLMVPVIWPGLMIVIDALMLFLIYDDTKTGTLKDDLLVALFFPGFFGLFYGIMAGAWFIAGGNMIFMVLVTPIVRALARCKTGKEIVNEEE